MNSLTNIKLPDPVTPNISSKFKFCPVTSVDVERSFSAFKSILNDKRAYLTMDHLEQYVIVYYYKYMSDLSD